MAFQIADLYATIRADDRQMQTALPTLQSKLKRVQVQMQKVSRVARRMLLVIGGVLALTIKHASTAEEMHAKFMTVFRDEGDAVAKWAEQYGKAVGRSKVDMETWLATIQDTFVPLGIARKEATQLSKTIVKLGIDLASFNEEADVAVIGNLQSALVGQSRAVLKYGIVIRESAVKQEAWRMGVRKAWDDVSVATKVQARMNIILRSSTDAQGDAIRTIGSFANQLKMLRARWKDAAAVLGQAFIPAAIRLMASVREMLEPIAEWVRLNRETTASIGITTVAVLGLLAVLPTLIASLSILAAHPVLVAMGLLAASLAKVKFEIMGINAEIRTIATGRLMPGLTTGELEARLTGLNVIRKKLDEELPELRQTAEEKGYDLPLLKMPVTAIVPAMIHNAILKATKAEYEGIVEQIHQVEEALKAVVATVDDVPPAVSGELTEAQEKWIDLFTAIERSRMKARAVVFEVLEDEIRAMTKAAREAGVLEEQKFNIIKFWEEQTARLKKRFADEDTARRQKAFWDAIRKQEAIAAKIKARARERVGAGRIAPAFTGIAEFAKRIQSAILRSREEAEQKRLMKEEIKIQTKQLEVEEDILTAVQAAALIPGFVLTL